MKKVQVFDKTLYELTDADVVFLNNSQGLVGDTSKIMKKLDKSREDNSKLRRELNTDKINFKNETNRLKRELSVLRSDVRNSQAYKTLKQEKTRIDKELSKLKEGLREVFRSINDYSDNDNDSDDYSGLDPRE